MTLSIQITIKIRWKWKITYAKLESININSEKKMIWFIKVQLKLVNNKLKINVSTIFNATSYCINTKSKH
jgi:hypothetical protein